MFRAEKVSFVSGRRFSSAEISFFSEPFSGPSGAAVA